MLRVIDWFAGIGGMRLAFERSGWRCVWACEIDADARAVYAAHFGHAPDAADIRDVEPAALPVSDCWVAGFPCQDLSVAGARRGFDGHRSALVFRLLELAAVVRPTWLVLENVPGLLSVRGGHDFGALLVALEDAGYVGAWRVLDAQWFGVPQRRRRTFLLARRAGASGPDPAAILLEPARLSRSDPPGGAPGEDVTRPVGTGSYGGRYGDLDHGALIARPLGSADNHRGHRIDLDHGMLISAPVTAREQKGPDSDCLSGQLVVANTVRACDGHHGWSSGRGDGADNLIADPISAHEGKTYSHEGAPNFRMRNVVFDMAQVTHPENRSRLEDGRPAPSIAVHSKLHVATVAAVRRLTPRECERLQGFPDDWTLDVGTRRLRDAARYRLIGNSVAVPCVTWVARRLARWLTTSTA